LKLLMGAPPSNPDALFVAPLIPQPGPMRIVGSGCWVVAPDAGNQCARIFVPSKEVMVQSLAMPGTGSACTGLGAARLQAGGVHEVDVLFAREASCPEPPPQAARRSENSISPVAAGSRVLGMSWLVTGAGAPRRCRCD